MTIYAQRTFELFKAAFLEWDEDNAPRLAAALAYYAAVSMAPLLVILLSIAGLAFGSEAAAGHVMGQIEHLVGKRGAAVAQDILANANKPTTGILSTIAGTFILLLGASGVFGALQDGLNAVWEVPPKPSRGVIGVFKDRFLSLTMVLGVGFLLLVSLVISASLAALAKYASPILPLPWFPLEALNFLTSTGVIALLFALIYKVLPDVEIAWRDVWIGATVTSLLFTIGKSAIGLYLGWATVGTAYGAAGSLVVILIWVYYSSQILFFGAELTQVYANRFGSRLKPMAETPVTRAV